MLPHLDSDAFIDWVGAICPGEGCPAAAAPRQLSLGGAFERDLVTSGAADGGLRSEVSLWRGGGSLVITLGGDPDEPRAPTVWRFELDDVAAALSWQPTEVTTTILLASSADEAVQAIARLLRHVARELGAAANRWPRDAMRSLAIQASALLTHLADTELARAARALHQRVAIDDRVRWWAFRRVIADASGRLMQLAEVCPALFSLLRWLELIGAESVVDEVLAGVVAGQRLPLLLGHALTVWADSVGLEDDDPRRRTHARLLRRLVYAPSPGEVARPLPEGANVDDLPQKRWRQQRWLRVMQYRLAVELGDAQRRGLAAFCSRHAVRLYAHGQRREGSRRGPRDEPCEEQMLTELLRWLQQYIGYEGRVPSRKSDPDRWIRECERWHQRVQWRNTALPPGTVLPRLPQLPRGEWREGELSFRQLVTRDELIAEGERMRHCVAADAVKALDDPVFYFHVRCGGAELTASVIRLLEGRGYELLELRGRDNRPATAAQVRVVEAWVAGLRVSLSEWGRGSGQ